MAYLTLVILPDHAELDHALRDGDDLQGLAVSGLLLEKSGVLEGRSKLCLDKNVISRAAPGEPLAEIAEIPAEHADKTIGRAMQWKKHASNGNQAHTFVGLLELGLVGEVLDGHYDCWFLLSAWIVKRDHATGYRFEIKEAFKEQIREQES